MVCDRCAALDLPVRWRLLEEKPQEFGGIGLAIKRVRPDAAGVTVVEVLDNGPAQRAGLKAGDVIMRIDGEPAAQYGSNGELIEQYTMDQVRDRLRGVGTPVRLSVEREGRLLSREIVVKRAAINVR